MLIMAGEGNEIADRTLEQIGKEMRELKEKDQELNLEDLEDVSGVLIFRNSRARYQHHEAIVRKKSR